MVAASIHAVHVVDVQAGDNDVFRRTEIIEKDVNTSANRRPRTVIRNFKVSHLDVLDVVKPDYIFDLTRAIDFRLRAVAVTVNDEDSFAASRLLRNQLSPPGSSGAEPDPVAWVKYGAIHFFETFPGSAVRCSWTCIVTRGGIDVVGGSGRD